jgi:ABC-type transporter Mla maintaining outer membrane lipid asymmetry permease subunit MlaE
MSFLFDEYNFGLNQINQINTILSPKKSTMLQKPQQPQQPQQSQQSQQSQQKVIVQVQDTKDKKIREVWKVISMTLIIVLAISLSYTMIFAMNEAITLNDFSFKQELGLKLTISALIFACLFVVKMFIL